MIQLEAIPKLYGAVKDHRQIEAEIQRLLLDTLQPEYTARPPNPAGTLTYIQKNFFSILFLSIYRALEIPKERRILYGLINHCLRGLVTGTDNLLDNEYKEMLPLAFPESAIRFKSVMHILLFDRFMFKVIDRAVDTGMLRRTDADPLHQRLFDAMVPIGAEESTEEGGVKSILTPEEILSSVHMYKGGKLLCLAFVAPQFLEREKAALLTQASQGIYSIGLALQIIDDLTDFYEDIRERNHNYLISTIYHCGEIDERVVLEKILSGEGDGSSIDTLFTSTTRQVMQIAIGEALSGFDVLHGAGFWLARKDAYRLIHYLFRLRGVDYLLPLFPTEEETLEVCVGQDCSLVPEQSSSHV